MINSCSCRHNEDDSLPSALYWSTYWPHAHTCTNISFIRGNVHINLMSRPTHRNEYVHHNSTHVCASARLHLLALLLRPPLTWVGFSIYSLIKRLIPTNSEWQSGDMAWWWKQTLVASWGFWNWLTLKSIFELFNSLETSLPPLCPTWHQQEVIEPLSHFAVVVIYSLV